jgi:cell division protein FtsI/penicillin-binding protein 2
LPISDENLKIVREGMREGVIYGSSVILNDLPVKAAAKTGTAETPRAGYYHNWVTVFAPYDDPQIVLTVMIENVQGLRTASLLVANEVLKWYFTR